MARHEDLLGSLALIPAERLEACLKMLQNEHFSDVMMRCWEIYDAKGNDYTVGKGDEDRLDNFKTVAKDIDIPLEKAWYVYTYKHWSAVKRYCKQGRVESEPIETRLYDIINYSILLLLHRRERAEKGKGGGCEPSGL
jgi:hypothetical protein